MSSCILVAGTIPKSMRDLTNLEKLFLHGNVALEKPPGCPLYLGEHMYYETKKEVAAFLRCLA